MLVLSVMRKPLTFDAFASVARAAAPATVTLAITSSAFACAVIPVAPKSVAIASTNTTFVALSSSVVVATSIAATSPWITKPPVTPAGKFAALVRRPALAVLTIGEESVTLVAAAVSAFAPATTKLAAVSLSA